MPLATQTSEVRRLATILSIDIAGFSRASEMDDVAAARHVRLLRAVCETCAKAHGGRVFNTAGDGLMLEFPSVSNGIDGALDIADAVKAEQSLPLIRMGLHVGDVTELANGDLIGTGVNVAARIQQRANPGEVLTSGEVKNLAGGQAQAGFSSFGSAPLDKMSRQVALFALSRPGIVVRQRFRTWAKQHHMVLRVAAAVLAIVVSFSLSYLFNGKGGADTPPAQQAAPVPSGPVIAVLPFENLSGDPAFSYFSDGITEEIQYALSRIRGVRVIARANSRDATDSDSGMSEKTRASHVLTGSVRKNGDGVRVSVQLALSNTGEIVWTQNFEKASGQTLAIQDDVAARVARALRVVVPGTSGADQVDPRAFELYLRGRDQWRSGGEGGKTPQLAITDLEEAVRVAPRFARGWAALASAYAQKQNWVTGPEQQKMVDKAIDAAKKALEIDSTMGEPYIILARFNPSPNWSERGELFAKAIAADPNDPDVQMLYADFWLKAIGKNDDAKRLLKSAFESDPLSDLIIGEYVNSLADTNDLAALEKLVNDNQSSNPLFGAFWQQIFFLKLQHGDMMGAHDALPKALAFIDQHKDELPAEKVVKAKQVMNDIMAAFEHNDAMLKQKLADQALLDAKDGQSSAAMQIENLAALGRSDVAFTVAEELYLHGGYKPVSSPGPTLSSEDGDVPVTFPLGRIPPSFLLGYTTTSMLKDVRIWRIFVATGVAKYWLDSGNWPDFCAMPDLGYDCKAEAQKALDAQKTN